MPMPTTGAASVSRAPHRMRLSTSRPNWSVPIRWRALGAARLSVVTWTGSYGAISGAASAAATTSSRKQSAPTPARSPYSSARASVASERTAQDDTPRVPDAGAAVVTWPTPLVARIPGRRKQGLRPSVWVRNPEIADVPRDAERCAEGAPNVPGRGGVPEGGACPPLLWPARRSSLAHPGEPDARAGDPVREVHDQVDHDVDDRDEQDDALHRW